MAARVYWADAIGTLKRSGYANIVFSGNVRDSLGAYGSYVADASNTGALTSEAILLDNAHNYNAVATESVTIPNNAVISQKVIYGDVTFAGLATINDCLFLGGLSVISTGNVGILNCNNSRTGIAKLKDCTIRSRTESDGRDGALGRQFELERCNISNVVDGVGIYHNTGGLSAAADVKVLGCYIHDNAYTYTDRDHFDGTHSDGIQLQGARLVQVIGNTLDGQGHYMAGSGTYYNLSPTTDAGDWPLQMPIPHSPGSGLMINGNVNSLDSTTIIDGNIVKNYKIQANIQSLANNFQFTNNKFSSVNPPAKNVNGTVRNSTTLAFTASEYWVRLNNQVTDNFNIIGLVSAGVISNTTNVWLDGASAGVAINTPRASGINNNNF